MKILGYILITVGFLAGALAAIVDQEHVRWNYFTGALAVGIAGIICVHTGHRRVHTSEEKLNENIRSVETALEKIVENITQLDSQKKSINPYDARHKIDELFLEELNIFIDARKSIAHIYGLSAYGDVMSSFAAGERYLNRVWSASADGYIDEVNMYIEKAREQFAESFEKIRRLKADAKNC
jgi:hypothetical protein